MTNDRLVLLNALEWNFCPYCGDKLEIDQKDSINLVLDKSVKHCGFHVRIWLTDDENCQKVK